MPFRFRVDNGTDVQLWRKELVGGDVAVAIANMHDNLTVPSGFQFEFRAVGFSPETHVAVRNLYTGQDLGWQKGSFSSQAPFRHMACSCFVYRAWLLHMYHMYRGDLRCTWLVLLTNRLYMYSFFRSRHCQQCRLGIESL